MPGFPLATDVLIAAILSREFEVTEARRCLATRIVGRKASLFQLLHAPREMERQLGVDITGYLTLAEPGEAELSARQGAHFTSGRGSRTRNSTPMYSRNSSTSDVSCCRPAGVSV